MCRKPAVRPVRPAHSNSSETKKIICPTHTAHDGHMIGLTPSTACELLPPPAGGPPPSRREVWGFRRSRPSALPSIAYRGFAVAPMTLRAPARNVVVITIQINGCGEKKTGAQCAPLRSQSLLYNPGCRVETLLVSMGVMGFLGDLRGRNRNLPLIP